MTLRVLAAASPGEVRVAVRMTTPCWTMRSGGRARRTGLAICIVGG